MQYNSIQFITRGVVLLLMSLMLVACGGGDGNNGGGGHGSVAVLLTDGPADAFDEINITVVRAELLGDGGRVTLFEGVETFNLLELTDAHLFAVRAGVPVGRYGKIRLTLNHVELVKRDAFGAVSERYEPKLPGNGKLDLVPRGDIAVVAGETLVLQIDLDANKSIHLVGTGSGKYQFRPVVFVDVLSADFIGKFIRVHGVVNTIDAGRREFLLCETAIRVRLDDLRSDPLSHCLQVTVDSETSIFAVNGTPVPFDELREGDQATVYGRLQPEDDNEDDDSRRALEGMELRALTIELGGPGSFQRLAGMAGTTVDSEGRFGFQVAAGQGFADETVLVVRLLDGARIINRRGVMLDTSAIGPDVAMQVDGILDLDAEPDRLDAALVIINGDAGAQGVLSGTVGANPDNACGFTLLTDSGDRSIRVGAATRLYRVTTTALLGSSERITLDQLPDGLAADVYGVAGSGGCFDADTIIAFSEGSS